MATSTSNSILTPAATLQLCLWQRELLEFLSYPAPPDLQLQENSK